MINWKNLKKNPPTESCNICLKIGVTYDTFQFRRYTAYSWELYKYPKAIGSEKYRIMLFTSILMRLNDDTQFKFLNHLT